MNIHSLNLGMLGTNCYILSAQSKALIIDPGGDEEVVQQYLEETQIQPVAIALTHAHFDHIGAVDGLRHHYDIPVYMHETEQDWLTDSSLNGSELFGVGEIASSKPPEYTLEEGKHDISGFECDILYTPGHSPGSISFWFSQDKMLIAGDTLFQRGIGRTDLPFGNHEELLESIENNILSLPDETIVYPGHGPKTTVKEEKHLNPFL
ncbi:MBL fold metallo-hydrolase [Tenuibacillus multivorans]|uniref:Glyoxylase, beta-lactamase superfamily II n=1 Tax=Tenuibacillus multivorans TaxID=237069 RepID=A0A1G9Z9M5_9BACI|nr:MBL fold metallo-hydrolase [Tenuibacillus multivorans]GEL77337.1 hypothetical protein TMU01_15720 [Tenuibacillus multivorans]SDN18132.1 Glyoxylase, beta-lactamase superfamily II [Tenuibacillus multivorans]